MQSAGRNLQPPLGSPIRNQQAETSSPLPLGSPIRNRRAETSSLPEGKFQGPSHFSDLTKLGRGKPPV
ncbi:MAG: hypothetical protein ACO34J_07890, partial [Prochlorothrix sp.]